MAGKRAAAEKVALDRIAALVPGTENVKLIKDLFARMSDKEFDQFIDALAKREKRLPIIIPNLQENTVTVERNLKLAKDWGHNFFERIWMNPGNGADPYLSNHPYLIVDVQLRRQAQHVIKKRSIPEDNSSVDDFSGQPTGKSKGSKLSYPEIQIMASAALDQSMTEQLKYRGGDIRGFAAMEESISRFGSVSLKALEQLGTQVQSTKTLSTFLTCMHLSNTLTKPTSTGG